MRGYLHVQGSVVSGVNWIGYKFAHHSLRQCLDEVEMRGRGNSLRRWRFENFKNS
jgi:hypothetical protein